MVLSAEARRLYTMETADKVQWISAEETHPPLSPLRQISAGNSGMNFGIRLDYPLVYVELSRNIIANRWMPQSARNLIWYR